jgi:hypothetical protein
MGMGAKMSVGKADMDKVVAPKVTEYITEVFLVIVCPKSYDFFL